VLAESEEYALLISMGIGHIKAKNNGKITYPTKNYWDKNPGFFSAIQRAIAARKPGVVQKLDQFAIVNDQVFAPTSENL
jgi:hypothetical protein